MNIQTTIRKINELMLNRVEELQKLKDQLDKLANDHECGSSEKEFNDKVQDIIDIYDEIEPIIETITNNYNTATQVAEYCIMLREMINRDCPNTECCSNNKEQ